MHTLPPQVSEVERGTDLPPEKGAVELREAMDDDVESSVSSLSSSSEQRTSHTLLYVSGK